MKTRIWLALMTLYIAWGTTYLAIRYALESMPPFFLTGTRFLVAGLVLYIWRRLAGDPAPTRQQWRATGIVGLFLLVGGVGGSTLAERFIPSGIAALVVAAMPLWVVLVSSLMPHGERPSERSLAGVMVGLAGIVILMGQGAGSGRDTGYNILGIAIVLLAGLAWAIGSIYSQHSRLPDSPLLSSGMEMLVGSAGSFMVGLVVGEGQQLNLAAISLRSLAGWGYLVVVGSLVGFVCYTWLLCVAPANLAVTYAYVNPLVAVVLGSLLAGELLTPRALIATPLILASVMLSQWKRPEKPFVKGRAVTAAPSAGQD
jgi:drug/metabolite transporter (DMT)-like permease